MMRNKLTQDRPTLFVDQYGDKVWATSARELSRKLGGAKLSKMYQDRKDGATVHVGYVARDRWFAAFHQATAVEEEAR